MKLTFRSACFMGVGLHVKYRPFRPSIQTLPPYISRMWLLIFEHPRFLSERRAATSSAAVRSACHKMGTKMEIAASATIGGAIDVNRASTAADAAMAVPGMAEKIVQATASFRCSAISLSQRLRSSLQSHSADVSSTSTDPMTSSPLSATLARRSDDTSSLRREATFISLSLANANRVMGHT